MFHKFGFDSNSYFILASRLADAGCCWFIRGWPGIFVWGKVVGNTLWGWFPVWAPKIPCGFGGCPNGLVWACVTWPKLPKDGVFVNWPGTCKLVCAIGALPADWP